MKADSAPSSTTFGVGFSDIIDDVVPCADTLWRAFRNGVLTLPTTSALRSSAANAPCETAARSRNMMNVLFMRNPPFSIVPDGMRVIRDRAHQPYRIVAGRGCDLHHKVR